MDIVGGIKKILVGILTGIKWVFNGIVNVFKRLFKKETKTEAVDQTE
jgi:hypothetical protein